MESVFLTGLIILLPVLFFTGYLIGKNAIKNSVKPKRIEEYPFYPFITNEHGIVEFSQLLFNEAVTYLIKNKNQFAAKQLIIIGEQNIVRDVLATSDLNNYLVIYHKYDGRKILAENDQFMENYKRIVTLIGKSFKGTGIEILLYLLLLY